MTDPQPDTNVRRGERIRMLCEALFPNDLIYNLSKMPRTETDASGEEFYRYFMFLQFLGMCRDDDFWAELNPKERELLGLAAQRYHYHSPLLNQLLHPA